MHLGVVLAGGAVSEQVVPAAVAEAAAAGAAWIVAADSGLDLAERLGLVPDLVVGDLDSVSAPALERAREAGIVVDAHPAAKDETDLELAMQAAVAARCHRLVVLGGAGGRFDHLLANVALLAHPQFPVPIEAWIGTDLVAVVTDHWSVALAPGRTFSVLAVHGDAVVSESGVRWPLDRHRLVPGSTEGVSNEALGGPVHITVDEGRALVVIPDAKDLA